MQVPATDAVTVQLTAALAELHTKTGWTCHDAGLDRTAHVTRALRLAGQASCVFAEPDAKAVTAAFRTA